MWGKFEQVGKWGFEDKPHPPPSPKERELLISLNPQKGVIEDFGHWGWCNCRVLRGG